MFVILLGGSLGGIRNSFMCRLPYSPGKIPEVLAMAGDNQSSQTANPTQCVAATASEARRYAPASLREDKPQNNPSDPVEIDYAERFLP